MSSPPISASGGGSRRARYSRSPSSGGAPASKRSKPSNSVDAGNGSDQHRVYTSICVKNINPKIPDNGKLETLLEWKIYTYIVFLLQKFVNCVITNFPNMVQIQLKYSIKIKNVSLL